MIIRPETPEDYRPIRQILIAAFKMHPFSHQTEHLIVEALRAADALTLALVAEVDGEVVGHIAFSAATIGEDSASWYLLGPVAVRPDHQGRGIARALIEAGLEGLRDRAASGCVLVGDPAFYQRFGFRQVPAVTCAGVPDQYVLCLPMADQVPAGGVSHHPAFSVEA